MEQNPGGKQSTEAARVADQIVTIDGPSGAGKSTAARLLASRLGYLYVDTGAMYRAVALEAARSGARPEDDAALGAVCAALELRLAPAEGGLRVFLRDEDVSDQIRHPEIGRLASLVSARRPVREALWRLQRSMGQAGRAVFEGRDTGTVVLPEARWKFFLTAAVEIRAARRCLELAARGIEADLETVRQEILTRDEADSSRALAPLRPAEDARTIDSSRLDALGVVSQMMRYIQSMP
ncbi:MAG: (d)CMP kinase [Pseudomonadota bacterium]